MSRKDAFLFLGVLGLALAMRVALWAPVWTPDCDRFVRQAADLSDGQGFRWKGRPALDLPPGYPVFIALLGKLGVPSGRLSTVNVILGSVTCGLLFLVVRQVGSRWAAALVAFALALNPWIARQCSYVMSETLTTFLCVVLLHVAWASGDGKGAPARAAVAGLLLSAIVLTAPGLLFVGAFGVVALVFRWRRTPLRVALLLASAGLVILPWQWHCLEATGHLVPTIFVPTEDLSSGVGRWARTWSGGEEDMRFVWHPEKLGSAPPRAFRSAAERARIVALAVSTSSDAPGRLEAELQRVAVERRQEYPLEPFGRSALRALFLWTKMPAGPFFRTDWAGHAFLSLLYLAYTLACVWGAVRGCWQRNGWALAVAAGTVAYTLVSGYTALGEARRNIPFEFLLLALLAGPRLSSRGAMLGESSLSGRVLGCEEAALESRER